MSPSKEPKKNAAVPDGKPFELKGPAAPAAPAQGRLPLKKPEPARPPAERRKRDSVRLVWDSKPKRPPSPRDIEFQTAEVVIPNPARDKDLLPTSYHDGILGNEELDRSKMNRLIWGDNLLAMQALLAQGYEGKIDLIYIDPPFFSNEDYNLELKVAVAGVGDLERQAPICEILGYSDTWEAGCDSFLDMLYPRLQLMRRLLKEAASIFIHMDYHLGHYVKILADEVFGTGKTFFRNEIIWKNQTASGRKAFAKQFPFTHQTIFWYSRGGDGFVYNAPFRPFTKEYIEQRFKGKDKRGRFKDYELESASPERLKELEDDERILRTPSGKIRVKQYLDESPGVPIDSIWLDIPAVNSQAYEANGYGTQKPETLLERIIMAASNEGDCVADFFCGSGTTVAVAERLGRKWLGCDMSKVGVQVARARLVLQDAKPFLIENIGNYQREMIYLSGGRIFEMQQIILKLFGADPHPKHKDLGTRQADDGTLELVHVGYPDRPTTARKVEELVYLAQELDGTGYKRLVVLAWDYDYNFDAEWEARLRAMRRKPNVEVHRRMIPPDVIDYLRKARNEEDFEKLADKVVFHEKPYLKLAAPVVEKGEKGKRQVTIAIDKYVVFDLPVSPKDQEKLREAVKDNFAVLIDYWAVDWAYDGATFRSEWQALRGTGKRTQIVPTTVTNAVDAGRKHTIAVRVVDIFGNDAAATCEVKT